jgi:hypothetical protein
VAEAQFWRDDDDYDDDGDDDDDITVFICSLNLCSTLKARVIFALIQNKMQIIALMI